MTDDVEDTEATLYDAIVEHTELEREDDETVEEFKDRLVQHFNDVDDDTFAAFPEQVRDWADDAIKVTKANRGARNKKALPVIDGLEEPVVEKPAKKEKAAKAPKKEKAAAGDKPKRAPPKRSENAGPSKRQQLEALLTQKGGATHETMKETLGWPSGCLTTARKIAVALGKDLVKEKRGDETFYHVG